MAKKILKRISLICLALLVGVGAFLLPTLNFKSNNTQLSHFAHADTIIQSYEFHGSNLWFPTEVHTYGVVGDDDEWTFPWAGVVWSNFRFEMLSDPNSNNILVLTVNSIAWNNAFSLNHNYSIVSGANIKSFTSVTQDIPDIDFVFNNTDIPEQQSWIRFYIKSNDWINVSANFIRVEIGQILYEWNSFITYCRYYDSNSNYVEISCVTLSNYNGTSSGSIDYDTREALKIPTRSYYFIDDLSESQIYQQGFADGESQGFADGESQGYNSGYSRGHEEGKNEGYYEGLEQNNPYTFDRLISSVIDVPVRTFTSLFNFTILGVNLAEFMLGLFTFCIIITLIRWCL